MFIVLLRFGSGMSRAGELMQAHNAWIQRGFDEGVFVLVGSLQPRLGGVIVAGPTTRAELEERVRADPFVVHDVVQVELLEIAPSKVDPRLAFLVA